MNRLASRRKRNRSRAAAAAVLVAVFFIFSPLMLPVSSAIASVAEASGTLSVGLTPVKTALDMRPGETVTFPATFSCAGSVPIRAKVSYRDAVVGNEGFVYAEPGPEFWSAGSWLKVEPEEFEIGPGQSRRLTVTVTVPPGTPDGQYYAAFFVQAAPSTGSGTSTVGLAGTIVSVVMISMGENTGRSAQLVPYGHVPRSDDGASGWAGITGSIRHWWRCLVIRARNAAFICETRPLKIFVPLENTGASHVQPRITVSLYEGGVLRHEEVVVGDIILPGKAKITEAAWRDPPLFARLRLDLKVEYGGAEPIEVERTFWVVPVKGILGLLVIAFGLGYLGANRGRKRERQRPVAKA